MVKHWWRRENEPCGLLTAATQFRCMCQTVPLQLSAELVWRIHSSNVKNTWRSPEWKVERFTSSPVTAVMALIFKTLRKTCLKWWFSVTGFSQILRKSQHQNYPPSLLKKSILIPDTSGTTHQKIIFHGANTVWCAWKDIISIVYLQYAKYLL